MAITDAKRWIPVRNPKTSIERSIVALGGVAVLINYNESVIVMHADQLYRRARTIAVVLMSFGALSSVLATWLLLRTGYLWARHPDSALPVLLLATIIGGLCGWALGDARAATLRLSAQLALCQLQIERNTRAALPRAATAR